MTGGLLCSRGSAGESPRPALRMTQPLSRLGKQLEEAIATFERIGARFALIGGLALAPEILSEPK